MGIVWFLISILIASIFYYRLSRRISGLNLELSEELKNEIMSLIAEFNSTAHKNITLIENKTNLAKSMSEDISNQLNYMKKLKGSLEKEIKESELKLKNILTNEKAVIKKIEKDKSIIQKTYESILKNTSSDNKNNKINNSDNKKNEEKNIKNENISLNDEIISLKNQGLSLSEIAQKLEITMGEVDLVRKFFKKQKGNN